MIAINLSESLDDNITMLKSRLPVGKSFDIISREIKFGSTRAYWVGINGMYNSNVMQLIMSDLQDSKCGSDMTVDDINRFVLEKIKFAQTQVCGDVESILKNIVSGPSAVFVDGFAEAVVIDLRTYPERGIGEPDNEKVMKGSKDGFVETMLSNANLIRRRIRSPSLTFEMKTVGSESKTDVAVSYIDGLTDKNLIEKVNNKIDSLKVSALTMGAKSLSELLIKSRWFNPMPCVRTTERPDVACSHLMEGNVLIIVDNSPEVIILPCTIFQFTQNPDDYYKNPVVGSFYRFIRFLCGLMSLYMLPVFLLIAGYMPELSYSLGLTDNNESGTAKLLFFVMFAEIGLDILKYASSHTINSLTSPISIVGGLIVSDVAIQLEWISPEVVFYGAVTLLTNLAVSSIEMSEAIRIYRLFLIIITGFFGVPGFIIGNLIILVSAATTPVFAGKSYFWPLIPFSWDGLKTILFRMPTAAAQPENMRKRRGN